MKKIFLLLLLFISVKAFAQYPTPTGVTRAGNMLYFYKIVGPDTLLYGIDAHNNVYPIGRGGGSGGIAGGELAGTYPNPTLLNSAVIAKVLTGYTSGAGTVASTDNILQAIQKLNGNGALKAPLNSPALTGIPTAPTATIGTNTTQIATTAFVLANSLGAAAVPQIIATASPYNIIADGSTDNTTGLATIQTACAAAGGCEVFLPPGVIKTTKLVISSSNQTWVGMGGIIPFGGSTATTTFTTSATTGVFVTISPGINSIKFQDIAFSCTGTATAGAGLHISNSVGFRMVDCSVNKFFRNVDFRSGYDYKFDGNVFSLPVERNVMIADSAIADAGDGSFVSNWFYSNVATSGVFQLEWQSGGGPKLVNNKFNGEGGTYYGAIHIDAHASTVDFFATNNSIENAVSYGILATAQTGITFASINITGGNIQAGLPVFVDSSIGGGSISGVTVMGVNFGATIGNACITVNNTDNVTIGPNNYIIGKPTSFTGDSHLNVWRPQSPITLSGTTPTYDLNLGVYQNLTLSGNTTLTLSNYQGGDTWFLAVTQDATGGRTLSIPSTVTVGGNSLDTAPGAISYIVGHQNIITTFSNVTGTVSSLTTTGSSGAASLSGGVLNIPNYTAAGLGAVPTARTVAGFALSSNVSLAALTPGTHLSGSAYDGSTARTWTTDATTTPTASVITAYDANSNLSANSFLAGYTTTATAAGTTTLTVSSTYNQFFTGSTTQTVTLPVASTLVLGQQFRVVNNSSGVVTVNSSGANSVQAMAASSSAIFTCILTSGTSAASWSVAYTAVAGGSTNIYNTDGTLTGARTLTSGGFALTINPQTNFTYYSGSGSLSTQLHLTDGVTGNAYLSGNGFLRGGGGNGTKIGTIASANSDVDGTKPNINLTATAMTLSTGISGTPVDFTDNVSGTIHTQFGGTHGDGFTMAQNFYVGTGTAAPYFKIFTASAGGVSVGTTPSDPGANNLYVQNAIKLASTQTSVNGSTSGTAVFSQPMQGTSYKVVIIKMASLLGAASYTFPVAFSTAPSVVATDDAAAGIVTSKSTTAVTVTGTTTSGALMLIGY